MRTTSIARGRLSILAVGVAAVVTVTGLPLVAGDSSAATATPAAPAPASASASASPGPGPSPALLISTAVYMSSSELIVRADGTRVAKLAASLFAAYKPFPQQPVQLDQRESGTTAWQSVAGTFMTDLAAVVRAEVVQTNPSQEYRFTFLPTTTHGGSVTRIVRLGTPPPPPAPTAATALRINAPGTTVTAATRYRTVLTVTLASGRSAVAGRSVVLRHRRTGVAAWTVGPVVKTGSSGRTAVTVAQTSTSEQYQFLFAGDVNYRPCASGVLTIKRR